MGNVFQYGSNCDLRRLNGPSRLNGAATNPRKAQTVENYALAFDKWSTDNKCAASDLIRGGNRKAWGILYEIPDDRIDGTGSPGAKTLAEIEVGYERKSIDVTVGNQTISAWTFLVKVNHRISDRATSAEYVRYIVNGLREHDVPEEYVDQVIDVAIANIRSVGGASVGEKPGIEKLRRRP